MSDAEKALERLNTQCESYGMFEYGSQKHADIETIRAAITAQSETGISNDGLLPCPFCGGQAKLRQTHRPSKFGQSEYNATIRIECCQCGAGTVRTGNWSRAIFIEKWNTRTPRTEDATNAVTLSKEDFERVKKTLTWIADPRDEGFPIELNDTRLTAHMVHLAKTALSICEKEIKPFLMR